MGNLPAGDRHRPIRAFAERFRAEFKPAFDAWLATKPLANDDVPSSPFEMAEYHMALPPCAAQKEEEASVVSADGERAGSIGDQSTLTALILAGQVSRFDWEELRDVAVNVAPLVLLFCVVRLAILLVA